MLLARALDVVERALMLGCGAPYAALVPRIAALGGTKSIEATAVRIARLGAATPQQPLAPPPQGADFRSRAQGQQARVMAMLRAQQSRALRHMTDDSPAPRAHPEEVKDEEGEQQREEGEEEEKDADESADDSGDGSDCGGSDGLCMLCHEPVCFSDCASECLKRPAGFATHIVASRIMAVVRRQSEQQCGPLSFVLTLSVPKDDDDEDREEEEEEVNKEEEEEEEDNEEEETETEWRDGIVQTCGHVMHCDCYVAYLERLGHVPAACPAYQCPLCSRHCNTLFPVVPRTFCHMPTAAARGLTWVAHAVSAQLGSGAAPATTAHGWYTRSALARQCALLRAVLCTTLAEGEHVLRAPGAELRPTTPRFWRACFDALWYLYQFTALQRAALAPTATATASATASASAAPGDRAPELARDPLLVCLDTMLAARAPSAAVFAAAAQHALAVAQAQAHLVHAARTGTDVATLPFFAAAGPAAVAAATTLVRACHATTTKTTTSTTTTGSTGGEQGVFDPEECTVGLLRRLLVAQRVLFGGSLAGARVPHEAAALLRALHLERPAVCTCVPVLAEAAAATATAATAGPRGLRLACDAPGLPRLHLVDLPREYVELAARFPAHYRGWRDVARDAALCLVCGALFPGGARARHALARHPARCAGTCPVLYLQHAAAVVVTPGGHGGPWAALCYLGPHGEDDVGLRKGLRLTLDRARCDDLLRALAAHAFDGRYPAIAPSHVPLT